MRKIIVSEMISVDGYFARENGDIDWHMVNEEFNEYAIKFLNTIDILLFGRITYQMFESYWPTAAKDPQTSPNDLEIAKLINTKTKIVFSKSLDKVEWEHAQLEKEITTEKIAELKKQPGKPAHPSGGNIVVYGSGTVVSALTNLGLVDEYFLFVAPVVLGNGKSLFKNLDKQLNLKLIETKTLENGVVLVRYETKKN